MKAVFTLGCSGSGKSTFAHELTKEGWEQIERDQCRRMHLGNTVGYKPGDLWTKWNFKNEGFVTQLVEDQIKIAHMAKKNIIFSDTNLNQDRLSQDMKKMESLGYECEVKYFPVDDVSVLIKRDKKRIESVGETVIRKQWMQWLTLPTSITGIKKYEPKKWFDETCIVVDIDGTVAKMHNRGPFEWEKVGQDHPRLEILAIIKNLKFANPSINIIFLSGRDGVCRPQTKAWLDEHFGYEYQLFMREAKDQRKDRIIKDELFWAHVEPFYEVMFVFDDRKQVCEYWTDIGVPLINVGNIYDDF